MNYKSSTIPVKGLFDSQSVHDPLVKNCCSILTEQSSCKLRENNLFLTKERKELNENNVNLYYIVHFMYTVCIYYTIILLILHPKNY